MRSSFDAFHDESQQLALLDEPAPAARRPRAVWTTVLAVGLPALAVLLAL